MTVPTPPESFETMVDEVLIKIDRGRFYGTPIYSEAKAALLAAHQASINGETSDGYHTFNELYEYRMLYNAAFLKLMSEDISDWNVHKSARHSDGEECFGGGWFIVMASLPTGQVSNHYELKDWDLFQIPERERADKWDGHTPQEAAKRLRNYLRAALPPTPEEGDK